MGRYDHLKQIAAPLFVKMRSVSEKIIREDSNRWNPPLDYIDFLREIGSGPIERSFNIFEGLIEPSEFYDPESTSQMEGVLLWGHSYMGDYFGFDTGNQWKVVVLSHVDLEIDALADTFEDYIVESINTALSYE